MLPSVCGLIGLEDVNLGRSSLFIFEIVKPGTSSRARGRMGPAKWRIKCSKSNLYFCFLFYFGVVRRDGLWTSPLVFRGPGP